MNRYIISALLGLFTTAAMAQETYESAQLSTSDLNGTAKYVGMGGAMEALGADISTINSNPAGIGLFRRSWIGASAGVTSQQADSPSGASFSKTGETNVDFNQIGFVICMPDDDDSGFGNGKGGFLNFGFNFHKSRNFNQVINAINSLNDASQSKLSYMRLASLKQESNAFPSKDSRWYYCGVLDELTYTVVNDYFSGWYDADKTEWTEGYSAADKYSFERYNRGYIGNYNFNISGNINNKVFLGLTVGVNDVHYKTDHLYNEQLIDATNAPRGLYGLSEYRKVTGTGYDIKLGAIFRPIDESPFRLGVYINTPTWYSLRCEGSMDVTGNGDFTDRKNMTKWYNFDYDYKIITPWKFGASIGHTFGNKVAFGATYEYSDYSSIKNRTSYVDWYDGYDDYGYFEDFYTSSYNDDQMNDNTCESLKGVSLFKAGVEIKPTDELAIRMGYNYQSAIYKKEGSKNILMDAHNSNGSYYATNDYVNWGDTQRLTFGLGYALSENVNLDLSYQYATQKGDFHPFQNIYGLDCHSIVNGQSVFDKSEDITGSVSEVKNNRHQFNVTLSYRF